MIDIRAFIRSLGDQAPAFFNTTEKTVARWMKSGSLPMKIYQKIELSVEAAKALEGGNQVRDIPIQTHINTEPAIDAITHLPKDINKKPFDVQFSGQPPPMIEIDPREQSFGNNLTRPGRINTQPLPPMKLRRTEDGQVEAYIDNHPKSPTVIPPTIDSGVGWGRPTEVIDVRQDKKP